MDGNVPSRAALATPAKELTTQATGLLYSGAATDRTIHRKIMPLASLSLSAERSGELGSPHGLRGGMAGSPGPHRSQPRPVSPYTILQSMAADVSSYPFEEGEEFVSSVMLDEALGGRTAKYALPDRVRSATKLARGRGGMGWGGMDDAAVMSKSVGGVGGVGGSIGSPYRQAHRSSSASNLVNKTYGSYGGGAGDRRPPSPERHLPGWPGSMAASKSAGLLGRPYAAPLQQTLVSHLSQPKLNPLEPHVHKQLQRRRHVVEGRRAAKNAHRWVSNALACSMSMLGRHQGIEHVRRQREGEAGAVVSQVARTKRVAKQRKARSQVYHQKRKMAALKLDRRAKGRTKELLQLQEHTRAELLQARRDALAEERAEYAVTHPRRASSLPELMQELMPVDGWGGLDGQPGPDRLKTSSAGTLQASVVGAQTEKETHMEKAIRMGIASRDGGSAGVEGGGMDGGMDGGMGGGVGGGAGEGAGVSVDGRPEQEDGNGMDGGTGMGGGADADKALLGKRSETSREGGGGMALEIPPPGTSPAGSRAGSPGGTVSTPGRERAPSASSLRESVEGGQRSRPNSGGRSRSGSGGGDGGGGEGGAGQRPSFSVSPRRRRSLSGDRKSRDGMSPHSGRSVRGGTGRSDSMEAGGGDIWDDMIDAPPDPGRTPQPWGNPNNSPPAGVSIEMWDNKQTFFGREEGDGEGGGVGGVPASEDWGAEGSPS